MSEITNPYTSRLIAQVELLRDAGPNEILYLRIRNAFYMAATKALEQSSDAILVCAAMQTEIQTSKWVPPIYMTRELYGREDQIIDAGLEGAFDVVREHAKGGFLEEENRHLAQEIAANALIRVAALKIAA